MYPIETSDSVHLYLSAEWTALDDDLDAGYDLAEEILYRTKFDDAQKLANQVEAQIASVRNEINEEITGMMLLRGEADRYPSFQYTVYLNYTDYYAFLLRVREEIAENPEAVAAHLREIRAFFNNRAGAIAAYAGNEESIARNRMPADRFMARRERTEREEVTYDLPMPSQREALICDSNVQFNHVIATSDDLGMEHLDAGLKAVARLINDLILEPVLREQMGVYGPFSSAEEPGSLYLGTISDPNVRETFDFYASLPERIARLEVTQEQLVGYIMNAYTEYALPAGELTGAINTALDILEGKAQDAALESMRQLKTVTPETVKEAAEIYRKAWERGVHNTAGSAAAINGAADLFEVILNPFGARDLSTVALADVGEDHESYELFGGE